MRFIIVPDRKTWQSQNFEIHFTTIVNFIMFVDRRIREMVGRAEPQLDHRMRLRNSLPI